MCTCLSGHNFTSGSNYGKTGWACVLLFFFASRQASAYAYVKTTATLLRGTGAGIGKPQPLQGDVYTGEWLPSQTLDLIYLGAQKITRYSNALPPIRWAWESTIKELIPIKFVSASVQQLPSVSHNTYVYSTNLS